MLPAGQDAAEALYRITYAAYYQHSLTVTSNIRPSQSALRPGRGRLLRRCRTMRR